MPDHGRVSSSSFLHLSTTVVYVCFKDDLGRYYACERRKSGRRDEIALFKVKMSREPRTQVRTTTDLRSRCFGSPLLAALLKNLPHILITRSVHNGCVHMYLGKFVIRVLHMGMSASCGKERKTQEGSSSKRIRFQKASPT